MATVQEYTVRLFINQKKKKRTWTLLFHSTV